MSKTPTGQFATLDGMRGVGAVLVVMGHGAIFFGGINLTGGGPALVDAFFVLSGFVIAYAYEPRFAAGMNIRTFMGAAPHPPDAACNAGDPPWLHNAGHVRHTLQRRHQSWSNARAPGPRRCS
jgi:PAB1-binding protein PBP1